MTITHYRLLCCAVWIVVAVTPCVAGNSASQDPFDALHELQATEQGPFAASQVILPHRQFFVLHTEDHSERIVLSQVEKPQWEILEEGEEDQEYVEEEDKIPDPLEPVNRVFFFINDKLYFIVIKPVSQGYAAVLPEGTRVAVRNFFNNLLMPVRFVNNLLQFKITSAGNELLRFGVNTTGGVLGLMDYAKKEMGIEMQEEDFGQTLGVWGLGPVFYIHWPVIGPSSVRDAIGRAGDYFLDPINYVDPTSDRIAIKAGERINRTSLVLGEYEDLKEEAFDPYIAFRDIYYQYRQRQIEE